MRKGYGPTGVSYTYEFNQFVEACDDAPLKVEMVFNGNTAMVEMNMTNATESERRALYDAIDCVSWAECEDSDESFQRFTLFAG